MKNFKYTSSYEEQEIKSILKERKRKIAKQQVIFSVIFLLVLVSLIMYIVRKTIYTEFNGYMSTEFHNLRAMEDVFVHEVYTSTGDQVFPGDTIFSYVYLSHFLDNENIFNEPEVFNQNREWRIQYNLARQDIEVLRVRIQELQKQLEVEDHNISFGLSSNANKMKLKKELAETEEEFKASQRKLRVMLNAVGETAELAKRTISVGQSELTFNDVQNIELMKELGLVRYFLSKNNAIVTKVWVPNYIGVLKGEPIVQTQDLDLKNSNLSVTCLVPVQDMHKINRNSRVEVIVNDDVSFYAHVNLLGTRTEEIPEHLRSAFSKEKMAVAVDLRIDEGQIIPFWVLVKNIPVTIRINRYKPSTYRSGVDYLNYDTTEGTLIRTDTLDVREK